MTEPVSGKFIIELVVESFKYLISLGAAGIAAFEWTITETMMVVGPSLAGKTSLIDYLQYGILLPEGQRGRTRRPVYAKHIIKKDNKSSLEMRIKSALDVPGPLPPQVQATDAIGEAPNLLVVMIDPTNDEIKNWLDSFLVDYVANYQGPDGNAARRKHPVLFFVINKIDKIEHKQRENIQQQYRAIITAKLSSIFGSRASDLPLLLCSLIDTDEAVSLARNVAITIALELANSRRARKR